MEVTVGEVMFAAGLAGCLICLVLLPVLGMIFQRQRKRLISKLEREM